MSKFRFLLAAAISAFLASCGNVQTVYVKPKIPKASKAAKVDLAKQTVPKPIYVPPEVVRVMILPYEDDQGVLHQGEFLYFTLKPGYWTIASDGRTERVRKMIYVVNTQRELSQDSVQPQPIPVRISEPSSGISQPSQVSQQDRESCSGDCQKKLQAIKKFVEQK